MPRPCHACGQVHDDYATVCPATGARLVAASTTVGQDEVLVGTVIADRYHVGEVLGQGTTGTVFAVEHLAFARPAAMKVLRPRYADADLLHRVFHGEARAAWTVTHPCLCEVLDIGALPDGTPFFVMERLDGETLSSRIGRERLSLAAAVDVMMQLLSAIDAIHARDLLLRDLRPNNVMLAHRRGCRPVAKILDFGLARAVPLDRVQDEWDALRSAVGASDGSGPLAIPYYLSPERARGEHGVEPASDLFVAATIFYESLTGQRPFASSSFNGLLLQIAQSAPAPLSDLRPDVSPELDDLVMRALSSNPRNRPASARELQDELRAVFEGGRRASTPMRAAPASSPMSTSRPPRPSSAPSFTSDVAMPSLPVSRDSIAEATLPPVTLPEAPAPDLDALYEDETRTDQKEGVAAVVARFDEASADNPQRTVPPPAAPNSIEIEVDLDGVHDDPTTSRGADVEAAILALAKLGREGEEEEETETMHLTPELRARIDQMAKNARDEAPVAPPSRPPSSKRR